MNMWKRNVLVAGLIVLIVLGIVMAGKRLQGPGIAPEVAGRVIEKIDARTGEAITRTFGEWRKLKHDSITVWKNPDTGDYTVVRPDVCYSCGEKIPGPFVSLLNPDTGDLLEEVLAQGPAAIDAARNAYICPKCGENAGLGGAMGGPGGPRRRRR